MNSLPRLLVFTILVPALRAVADDAVPAKGTSGSAEEWIGRRVAELKEYQVSISGDGQKLRPTLVEQPVLNWSNPLRNAVRGAVFVWTLDEVPQLICCTFPDGNQGKMTHEMQSLAAGRIEWTHPVLGDWQFEPPADFEPIPDAPRPGKSRSLRLVQMRKLASRFSAEVAHPELTKVRLLTQPVYRYPEDADRDGAIFALVQGTDPECLLVMEPRDDVWVCRALRMTSVRLIVHRDGQLLREFAPGWEVRDPSYRNFYIDAK